MLYICIPVHNEAPTIGVLLWRLRGAFQDFSREYELVVYDDGSTDATAEVLEPYAKVLPLTVLGGRERRGYAAALDALARHVAAHTRYPRRDAMIVMEGDFTDRPEHIPELVKRFEGGADVVVTERRLSKRDPQGARRLHRVAPWILRPFVRLEGVADLTSTYRLIRISALRDLLRERGDRPLVATDGWAANAELLLALAPHTRRIESIPVEPRYEVRTRETRVRALADAMALARAGWSLRGLRAAARPAARALPTSPVRPVPEPAPLESAPSREPSPALALADAAPAPARKRKRPRRETAAASPAVDEAPSPTPAAEEAPEERKRRRRRRRSRSEAGDAAAVEGAVDGATTDGSAAGLDPATPEMAEDAPAVEGEGQPTRARRSRRSRKRRSATRNGAEATETDPGPSDAEPSSVGASGESVEGEGEGEGEPAKARRRRSRRGRRRGSRAAEGGEAGDSGAPAEPPAAVVPTADAS